MEWSQATAIGAAVVSIASAATVMFKAYRNLNRHLDDRFALKIEVAELRTAVTALESRKILRAEIGLVYLSEEQHKDYPLNHGKGVREFRRHVGFESAFGTTPRILIAISRVNINVTGDPSLKLHARTDAVTPFGFDVIIELRHETLLHSVEINWLAVGC